MSRSSLIYTVNVYALFSDKFLINHRNLHFFVNPSCELENYVGLLSLEDLFSV